MNYSERILKTVQLMKPGYCLADIGCDHGYMSVLAAENRIFEKVYACDVKEGPLSRARETISVSAFRDRIRIILSDGFADVPGDVTAAVICGMGGLLIRDILIRAGERINALEQLVLGPHSEVEELRRFILKETGFGIFRETAVSDSGKFYTLLDVRPKGNAVSVYHTEADILLGSPWNQTDLTAYLRNLEFRNEKIRTALTLCKTGSSIRSGQRTVLLKEELLSVESRINAVKEMI